MGASVVKRISPTRGKPRVIHNMRVLDVEVVVTLLDLLDADLPCDFGFLALVPPVDAGLEVLEADGFGHGVGFLPLGDPVLVVPDFFRGDAPVPVDGSKDARCRVSNRDRWRGDDRG